MVLIVAMNANPGFRIRNFGNMNNNLVFALLPRKRTKKSYDYYSINFYQFVLRGGPMMSLKLPTINDFNSCYECKSWF